MDPLMAQPLPAEVVDLTTVLADAQLANPVMTASGCAAAGQELAQFFDVSALGAVVTKSIMRDARSGRATPRMTETPSGMLNSIGLQGPGINAFLARDLPWLLHHDARPIVSIAGSSLGEYAELARRVGNTPGVAAIEVNISCPNVEDRGLVFACDPVQSGRVLSAVRRDVPRGVPVFAKLSPDVTSIVDIARSVVEAGADGLVLINTLLGLSINFATMRPELGGVTGGLSGPAVRPVAVRAVWQVANALPGVPIIGVGGIRTGADALEFLVAGASAVQVGTTIFSDPQAPIRVLEELRSELAAHGFAKAQDAVGFANRRIGFGPSVTCVRPLRCQIAGRDGHAWAAVPGHRPTPELAGKLGPRTTTCKGWRDSRSRRSKLSLSRLRS
ncbi:MAG: dihydroorotate dehydrogenase [Nocardioidaceae bacterium]